MCQSVMFKLISLGMSMGNEPEIDLRNFWRKISVLTESYNEQTHPQRALITRGRILMYEGQRRFLSYLLEYSKKNSIDEYANELISLLEKHQLPTFMEDRTFIARFSK